MKRPGLARSGWQALACVGTLLLLLGTLSAAGMNSHLQAAPITPVPASGSDGPGPTGTPAPAPSPTYPFHWTYTPPAAAPFMPVPPPAPVVAVDQDAVENILLLGSDSPDNYIRRTDVIILVSINKQAGTVALWHLPRALLVYLPNGTLDLLNVAFAYGESHDYPGGGFGLLIDTFRYNFGIELDHYARVNYPGFLDIVDALGGLTISVDCAIRDWRLKDPELDPALEDSWEQYTLIPGRHKLSPYMTLWYVRSRKTTSDLDRGRRQMDVLRAMWQQAQREGLISEIADLWPRVSAAVDTDLTLSDVLALAPLALEVEISRVARYGGALGVQYTRTFTPAGMEVLVPNRENLLPMIEDLLTPPTGNRLGRAAVTVELADASRYYTGLEQVAADRLAWEGFAARPLPEPAPVERALSVIYDYTGQTKGSALPDLQRILRVDDAHVISQPDPNRAVDYRVEIGSAYNLCEISYAEAELPVAPPPEVAGATCWLNFRAQVNVRAAPGTDSAVLAVVTPTDHLAVIGRNAAGTWWQVQHDGAPGWVSAEINTVDTLGDCGAVPEVSSP